MKTQNARNNQMTVTVRGIKCDYCPTEQIKPDQREKQIDGWAKIIIKRTYPRKGLFSRSKVIYHETDMCPDCIKGRKIHQTSTGEINL